MQPTHVVVDTRDGYTWFMGEDGRPMVEATAGRFATKRNDELPRERQTYRVFALVPADPFVVSDSGDLQTGRMARTLGRFPTEQGAAEYISTLPEHETGRYNLDGPADDW